MKNIVFISLLLLLSCHRQDFNSFILPEETPIKGTNYPNEIIMNFPWSMDIVEDKLLLFTIKDEHVIRIFDANSGLEVNHLGVFGNGPGEFIQPEYWGINKNKEIHLYETRQKKLRVYNWKDIKNTSELPKTDGVPLKNKDLLIVSGKILNNNYFVGASVFGLSKSIVVLDNNLNVTENMGAVPDKKHESKALVSYSGSVSTYENKFVFVMASLGYVACYEQLQDGKSTMLWDRYAEEPIYDGDQLDRKQLKLGFSDVRMTKNYIFCCYFGQKYVRENRKNIKPRNILVFDHQGNLLKNLHSDRSVGKITVSADEKTLYAITEEPEVAIIRFDISNLIK